MANTTVKFDSIINFLRSRSSAVIKNAVNDLAFEGLNCVHQFRTDHALNQALNVLKTVQGGSTVLKYWKEVAPFSFSSADGFHGKMKDKKWDVYKVPSFSAWKEEQIVFRAFPIPFENHSALTAATAVLEMDWQISSTEVLIEEAALITVFSYFCIMAAAAIL